MNDPRVRPVLGAVLAVLGPLVAVTIVVAILESAGIEDASLVYLLAVVLTAVVAGTWPAVATAVGAFLAYDVLFVQPRYTLTVDDPKEWLDLLLLLVVGIVVGRLAGSARNRAEAAVEGERSATSMFDVSFTLSTRRDTSSALGPLADIVRADTRAERVWIVVGDSVTADTAPDQGPPGAPAVHVVLRRRAGDEPAEWVRIHAGQAKSGRSLGATRQVAYRVVIAATGETFGSLWVVRRGSLGEPNKGETRLMAAAADQIGTALERDRLLRDATAAEVSRRSEALKSALLDSVSHDLRTPLATIRAAAGTLMDPDIEWPPDRRREIAGSIDREAEWLNRLVTNLLDMSRIEAGELRPNLVVMTVGDAVDEALRRARPALGDRPLEVDVPDDLAPILVDEVLMGQVLANTLDNAAKYAGPGVPVRVSSRETEDHRVRITVEDGGPGVPPEAMPRLFDKFYRVPRKGEGSRRGTGIGLAVVRGIIEATGGRVVARTSDLGGLALDFDLPMAAPDGPTPQPDVVQDGA